VPCVVTLTACDFSSFFNKDNDALIAEYEAEIEVLNEELSALVRQLQELSNSSSAAIANLEETIDGLNDQLQELTDENREQAAVISELSSEIDDLEEVIRQLNILNEFLQQTLTEWENRSDPIYGYIVTFYIGEIIWDVQIVEPGGYLELPAEPVIDMQLFDGWSLDGINIIDLSLLEIESDISLYSVSTAVISFAEDSPALISRVSSTNRAYDFYNLGDERSIVIDNDAYIFLILGFNHDDKSDGSGKAGISLGMRDLYNTKVRMTTGSATNIGGWSGSGARSLLNVMYYTVFDSEWRPFVQTVLKSTTIGGGSTATPEYSIQVTEDKLFMFSLLEVHYDLSYVLSGTFALGEGALYEYYTTFPEDIPAEEYISYSYIRLTREFDGSRSDWWLRSPMISKSNEYRIVSFMYGFPLSMYSDSLYGLCFGFCV
jgi:hypothetical protein